MSYDVFFNNRTFNITSNITPMTKAAGLYLPDLHGLTGAQAQPRLASCLMYLTNYNNSRSLRKLEPINGWGTLEHTITFLTRLYFTLNEDLDQVIGVHS